MTYAILLYRTSVRSFDHLLMQLHVFECTVHIRAPVPLLREDNIRIWHRDSSRRRCSCLLTVSPTELSECTGLRSSYRVAEIWAETIRYTRALSTAEQWCESLFSRRWFVSLEKWISVTIRETRPEENRLTRWNPGVSRFPRLAIAPSG